MDPDTLNAPDADRGEAKVVLQESEALNSGAAAVEAALLVGAACDAELSFRLATVAKIAW